MERPADRPTSPPQRARRAASSWDGLTIAGVALFKPVRGALTFSTQIDPLIMVLLAGTVLALGLLDDFVAAASHWGGPIMAASPVGQSAYSLLLRTLTVQPYTVPLVEAPPDAVSPPLLH